VLGQGGDAGRQREGSCLHLAVGLLGPVAARSGPVLADEAIPLYEAAVIALVEPVAARLMALELAHGARGAAQRGGARRGVCDGPRVHEATCGGGRGVGGGGGGRGVGGGGGGGGVGGGGGGGRGVGRGVGRVLANIWAPSC